MNKLQEIDEEMRVVAKKIWERDLELKSLKQQYNLLRQNYNRLLDEKFKTNDTTNRNSKEST